MLKRITSICIFASLLVAGYMQTNFSSHEQTELTKENIEALAFWDGLVEWWDRKDYSCVPVTCKCIIFEYQSTTSTKVADGTGDYAHNFFNCPECDKECAPLNKN